MHHLIGGPFPAWLITASVVASVMMFVPVVTVAINHHFTMRGHFKDLIYSPTLRFVVFGAMSYTLVSFQGSLMAIRSVNHAHLGAYAFASMVFFGAIYYIMPRLLAKEWPSRWLIRLHFWPSAIGIAVYFVGLTYGGVLQGLELNQSDTPFLEIVELTLPYLKSRTIGGTLMTLGHLAFAISFFWMLFAHRREDATPTLFTDRRPSPIPS